VIGTYFGCLKDFLEFCDYPEQLPTLGMHSFARNFGWMSGVAPSTLLRFIGPKLLLGVLEKSFWLFWLWLGNFEWPLENSAGLICA